MRRSIGVFLLLVITGMALAGCGSGTPKIRSAEMVKNEVGEDEKPQTVESYPADRAEFLLYGKALHFGEGDRLIVRWIYEEDGGYVIREDTDHSGYVYEFYSRLRNAGYPWPQGSYRAEVYVNDDTEPDATVRFRVE